MIKIERITFILIGKLKQIQRKSRRRIETEMQFRRARPMMTLSHTIEMFNKLKIKKKRERERKKERKAIGH